MNDNIELVKEFKDDNMTVLVISYKFIDKTINGMGLGPKIKKYYEQNSRNKVKLNITYFTAVFKTTFGYTAQNVQIATNQANLKFGPKKFKYYVHVCNPVKSTSGGNATKTYNSATNAIHEFGHLLGFGHSNKMDYTGKEPKKLYGKDPFDAVIVFAVYPSLSPPHLYNHGWYLPGEIVLAKNNTTYTLYMLRDFSTSGVKTLGYYKNDRLYFVSYGWKPVRKTKVPEYFLIIHYTDSGYNYSFLDVCYSLSKMPQSFEHKRTGFTFNIIKNDPKFLDIQVLGQSDSEMGTGEIEIDHIEDSKVDDEIQEDF